MKTTLSWFVVILAISLISAAYLKQKHKARPQPSHVNIICIGDSITQGGNIGRDEFTYRLPLYRLLKKSSLKFNFIGAHQSGVNAAFKWPADFEPNHEGFYGTEPAIVRDNVKEDLPKLPAPDIALIHMGTQHNVRMVEATVMQPMTEIITELRKRNPNVKVVIMQIPGVWRNKRLHILIWYMAHKLSTPQSEITTVPLFWDWDEVKDTFDGVHPNVNGQHKIAEKLYLELVRILPINQLRNTD
jgi:lysophospholipase L1-like esterase